MTKKHVISVVTNDLSGDQRVHKTLTSLVRVGWTALLFGRKLSSSTPLLRDYETRRIHLLFNKGPLFYACFNFRLVLHLFFKRADLLIANDLDTLPAIWVLSKLRRIPYIFDSHEYFTEVPELVDRPLVQKIWKRLERFLVPKTKYMLTVNKAIAEVFEDEYDIKPGVLMNLPLHSRSDLLEAKVDLPAHFVAKKIIIYQGAVNVGRGLEQMIDALPLLPDYVLLIVGDGDILRELKDRVQKADLKENVIFTGRMDMKELPALTALATVGMSLEQDLGLNYRLALPNKLFDYMSAGIPVIVSDLPVMASLVREEHIGIVVKAYDPESIKSAILRFSPGSEQYVAWCKSALLAAKKYTWESQENVLLNLCDRAISES